MASSHSSVKARMGVSRVTGHAAGSVAVVPPPRVRVLHCGSAATVQAARTKAATAGERASWGQSQGQCGVREVADWPVGRQPVDWFYVSPPFGFGAHNPGTKTGTYRLGTDVLVTDADGNADISGADFATAFADEIEKPAHHQSRFTLAY
jgi:putative NADH-flavin reductase